VDCTPGSDDGVVWRLRLARGESGNGVLLMLFELFDPTLLTHNHGAGNVYRLYSGYLT
jgi:hypothetical protein